MFGRCPSGEKTKKYWRKKLFIIGLGIRVLSFPPQCLWVRKKIIAVLPRKRLIRLFRLQWLIKPQIQGRKDINGGKVNLLVCVHQSASSLRNPSFPCIGAGGLRVSPLIISAVSVLRINVAFDITSCFPEGWRLRWSRSKLFSLWPQSIHAGDKLTVPFTTVGA